MKKIIVTIFLIVIFAGCASGPRPTAEQLRTANYGPSPQGWEQTVKEAIAQELTIPENIYIRKLTKPKKVWIATPDRELLYGWGVCGFIATPHLEPFFVMFRDDQPIYKVMGLYNAKKVSGKSWSHESGISRVYDTCPELYRD